MSYSSPVNINIQDSTGSNICDALNKKDDIYFESLSFAIEELEGRTIALPEKSHRNQFYNQLIDQVSFVNDLVSSTNTICLETDEAFQCLVINNDAGPRSPISVLELIFVLQNLSYHLPNKTLHIGLGDMDYYWVDFDFTNGVVSNIKDRFLAEDGGYFFYSSGNELTLLFGNLNWLNQIKQSVKTEKTQNEKYVEPLNNFITYKDKNVKIGNLLNNRFLQKCEKVNYMHLSQELDELKADEEIFSGLVDFVEVRNFPFSIYSKTVFYRLCEKLQIIEIENNNFKQSLTGSYKNYLHLDLAWRLTAGPEKIDQLPFYEGVKNWCNSKSSTGIELVWRNLPWCPDMESYKNFQETQEMLSGSYTHYLNIEINKFSKKEKAVLSFLVDNTKSLLFSVAFLKGCYSIENFAKAILASNVKFYNGQRISNITEEEYDFFINSYLEADKKIKLFLENSK
jgi:hypothetical protein